MMTLSRAAKVKEVSISSDEGGAGLPTLTLTICLAKTDAIPGIPDLQHEHVVVELTAEIRDAIDEARRALTDMATAE